MWIEDDGTPVPILWPEGFTARFDPVELIGPDGEVVAREGDVVRGSGGSHPVEMEQCDMGKDRAFRLNEVGVATTGEE